MRRWPVTVPVSAILVMAAGLGLGVGPLLAIVCSLALVGGVVAAVHHAEVVAHRVGEPFGTLILALAVTVIEASLILSMMLAGGAETAALPRDTLFSAVMIICAGVVGICVLVGGLRHREQTFRIEGAGSGLSALMTMVTLTMVLPSFTTSSPGNTYTPTQLAFAAASSLALWIAFVFVQTVRHRDYFLPGEAADDEQRHEPAPSRRAAWASAGLLVVSLVGVVGLAKLLSPWIESLIVAVGAPKTVIGIAIAMLVLAPETVAALRAARANRLQTSLNLALGSALASIGLTVPVVAVASLVLGMPLQLGLDAKDLVLLVLTFVVNTVTLGSGRTHLLPGVVHLVIFAAFLALAFAP